jgi:hypothetical protein
LVLNNFKLIKENQMRIEIKSRYNMTILFSLKTESMKICLEMAVKQGADLQGADLRGADLRGADLQGADLRGADLRGADLQGADLQGAYLQRAYLQGADLQRADLQGADLRGAEGVNKNLVTPLRILLEQTGNIRAYKLVKSDGLAPFNGGIIYEIGKDYEVLSANTDEFLQCAPGINLATLDWCMREWEEGYRILIAEFTAKDIACVPIATDGKFRVFRCKIVGEKDLKEIGLTKGESNE